jgi:hypothetical protein
MAQFWTIHTASKQLSVDAQIVQSAKPRLSVRSTPAKLQLQRTQAELQLQCATPKL